MPYDIYSDLNEKQRKAVTAPLKPLAVLAGAGSGKTRVLTYRVFHFVLHEKMNPRRIFAVTFTNKAADEMRSRLESMYRKYVGTKYVDQGTLFPWVRTFHSAGLRLLRRYLGDSYALDVILSHIRDLLPVSEVFINIGPNFTVADDSDSKSIVKSILKDFAPASSGRKAVDDKAIKTFLEYLSLAKRKGIYDPYKFDLYYSTSYWRYPISYGELFREYHKVLYTSGRLDFDDLLGFTSMLLKDPKIGGDIRGLFDAILIDEFQDVNDIQYFIGSQLAKEHKNITVVGDLQQSIYSWRGSSPLFFSKFMEDFPEAEIITLDINYRSSQRIVSVANNISRYMDVEYRFDVVPNTHEEGKVEIIVLDDDYMEARYVANMIDTLRVREGIPFDDIAVMYRTNAQSRRFEEIFSRYGIPYVLVRGISFYARREIKDILSYLVLISNIRDKVAWQRIINVPPRGIGKVSQEKIWRHFDEIDDIGDIAHYLSGKAASSFRKLYSHILKWKKMVEEGTSLVDLIQQVLEDTGYVRFLEEQGEIDRIDNIGELINIVSVYDIEEKSLTDFLSDMVLRTDQDMLDKDNGVKLMTIHAAKGLEFDAVFLVGVEDGYIPYRWGGRGWKDIEDEEEEKRLFYVAITRPKRYLFITYAKYRYMWGEVEARMPSPYLYYVEEVLEKQNTADEVVGYDNRYTSYEYEEISYADDILKVPIEDVYMVSLGDKVYSDIFGFGYVVDVYEDSGSIRVEFDDGTRRRLKISRAKLYKIIEEI